LVHAVFLREVNDMYKPVEVKDAFSIQAETYDPTYVSRPPALVRFHASRGEVTLNNPKTWCWSQLHLLLDRDTWARIRPILPANRLFARMYLVFTDMLTLNCLSSTQESARKLDIDKLVGQCRKDLFDHFSRFLMWVYYYWSGLIYQDRTDDTNFIILMDPFREHRCAKKPSRFYEQFGILDTPRNNKYCEPDCKPDEMMTKLCAIFFANGEKSEENWMTAIEFIDIAWRLLLEQHARVLRSELLNKQLPMGTSVKHLSAVTALAKTLQDFASNKSPAKNHFLLNDTGYVVCSLALIEKKEDVKEDDDDDEEKKTEKKTKTKGMSKTTGTTTAKASLAPRSAVHLYDSVENKAFDLAYESLSERLTEKTYPSGKQKNTDAIFVPQWDLGFRKDDASDREKKEETYSNTPPTAVTHWALKDIVAFLDADPRARLSTHLELWSTQLLLGPCVSLTELIHKLPAMVREPIPKEVKEEDGETRKLTKKEKDAMTKKRDQKEAAWQTQTREWLEPFQSIHTADEEKGEGIIGASTTDHKRKRGRHGSAGSEHTRSYKPREANQRIILEEISEEVFRATRATFGFMVRTCGGNVNNKSQDQTHHVIEMCQAAFSSPAVSFAGEFLSWFDALFNPLFQYPSNRGTLVCCRTWNQKTLCLGRPPEQRDSSGDHWVYAYAVPGNYSAISLQLGNRDVTSIKEIGRSSCFDQSIHHLAQEHFGLVHVDCKTRDCKDHPECLVSRLPVLGSAAFTSHYSVEETIALDNYKRSCRHTVLTNHPHTIPLCEVFDYLQERMTNGSYWDLCPGPDLLLEILYWMAHQSGFKPMKPKPRETLEVRTFKKLVDCTTDTTHAIIHAFWNDQWILCMSDQNIPVAVSLWSVLLDAVGELRSTRKWTDERTKLLVYKALKDAITYWTTEILVPLCVCERSRRPFCTYVLETKQLPPPAVLPDMNALNDGIALIKQGVEHLGKTMRHQGKIATDYLDPGMELVRATIKDFEKKTKAAENEKKDRDEPMVPIPKESLSETEDKQRVECKVNIATMLYVFHKTNFPSETQDAMTVLFKEWEAWKAQQKTKPPEVAVEPVSSSSSSSSSSASSSSSSSSSSKPPTEKHPKKKQKK